jgi:streptogramin lyase
MSTGLSTKDGASVIRKVGLNGGASSPVAAGLGYLLELAVSGTALYVLEDPRSGPGNADARILKVPVPTGIDMESPPVFSSAGFSTRSMTVDDTGVYWTQRDPEATIRYCPHQGCANGVVLADSVKPWGIVTDELAVYWTTEDGQMMKLAE